MSLTLPSTVASRRDLARLRTEVELYRAWANQYSLAKRRKISYSHEQPDLSDTARIIIRGWIESKQTTDDLLVELQRLESSAPSITVTLARNPTADTRQSLVEWCRRELAPDMLVTINWSAHLLGGVVVRTDHGIHDWSYRRQLRANKPKLVRRLQHAR